MRRGLHCQEIHEFLQHQQRFSYLSEVRAAKVNASIVDYLRRLRVNEATREKKFSRGSALVP